MSSDASRCMNGHSMTPANTYTDKEGRVHCRACRADRQRIYRQRKDRGEVHSASQRDLYCKNGHLRTPENTYVAKNGWKKCRTCSTTRIHRYDPVLDEIPEEWTESDKEQGLPELLERLRKAV